MSTDRISDFGKKLRDAREARGVTLRQIANATKLSVSQLEALERNDIARLPGGIFSRGIVRSYASEVGLDPEGAIKEFIAHFSHDEAVTAGHPASVQTEDNEALESDRRMASAFIWVFGLSLPIAGAVVYFSTVGRHPAAVVPIVQTQAAETKSIDPPAAATNNPAAEPAPVPTAGVPGEPPSPAGISAGTAPAPAAASAPATEDRLTVALSVKRPCWVSATVDGKRAIERLLAAGTETTLDVKKELVLTAGDAGAISITLNGAGAKPLGKTGEVVTAKYTPSNFRAYLQPR